ncbi:PatB family C-S lyase [Persicobacter diffluens]|uniref:cysteine-S-conjugate beta-lyase n=1 Tax=Persicobacter diffluens TaxID=981 RepID=A0AAN4W3C7_9BACT|nr:cystathionine beta-lyase [Persicobacter diffluens]
MGSAIFDQEIDRSNTRTVKYELRKAYFGKEDVDPLWVADMDFACPKEVQEAVMKRAAHPIYGYPIADDEFKRAIVNWNLNRHQWKIETDWIHNLPGVVPALVVATLAFSVPEDEIIVQPPVYFPFFDVVKGLNRKLVQNPLTLENDQYRMDFQDLESKITARTKIIFLCNPHNPSGKMWDQNSLNRLGEICKKHDILVVSDEIHADLTLWGNQHVPTASVSEVLKERTITAMSASKSFNLAGLSCAYTVIANASIRHQFYKMLEATHLFIGNVFGIEATIAAYKEGETWLNDLTAYLEGTILEMEEYVEREIPDLKLMRPEAGYLVWFNFEAFGNPASIRRALIEAGVGLSVGASFGKEGMDFQRMNIACPRHVVMRNMKRIKETLLTGKHL